MLGINCLVRTPELKVELKDLIESVGWAIAAGQENPVTGKPYKGAPTVANVYRELRAMGIEIDAQTLSHLYGEVFQSHPAFDQEDVLQDFRQQAYRDLVAAQADEIKVREIGRESPVTAVVSALMQQVKLMSEKETSIQRLFQDRLAKAAKRVTGFKGEGGAQRQTAEEILREVLNLERNHPFGAGFSRMQNAKILWEEFRKEFNEMADILESKDDVYNADKIRTYADILENATYKFLMSTREIQQVINDTLKEAGYGRTIQMQSGKTYQTVDWEKVFADTAFDFRRTLKEVFRNKGFTPSEVDRIADELEDDFKKMQDAKRQNILNQRNKIKTREQKSALHRLNHLYNYGIFNNAQQQALFNVLGVKQATQNQINALQQLMAIHNKAMQNPISQWSATYMKTLQREVERIIEQAEESKDGVLMAIRKFSFFSQVNNALMLSNPQNITENTLSGAFQSIITAIFTQPGEAANTLSVIWNVWKDVAKGGVREGHEQFNTFNTTANVEDMRNFETAKTTKEKITSFFGLLPRIALSSMDNSLKAGLIHQIGLDMLKKEMKRQGMSKEDIATTINEIFYGNKAEIDQIADTLVQNLIAAGVNIKGDSKKKRIAAELAWANMVMDGDFFLNTYANLVSSGRINNVDLKINENLIKQIRNAAEAAASKGLGHQSDSWIISFMDKWAQNLGVDVQQARKTGVGLVRAEGLRTLYSQVNRYRPGSIRWMWLTLEKTTGLALLQTLITDVAWRGIRSGTWKNKYSDIEIDIDENNKEAVNKRARDLEWYASLKQRLIREMMGPVFGYASLLVLQAAMSGGDDDDKKSQLLKLAIMIKKDRTLDRWYQKLLPPRAYNYLQSLAWRNKFGEIVSKRSSEVELPDSMDLMEKFFSWETAVNTFYVNYNQSSTQNFVDAIEAISIGDKEKGYGKLGEAILNSMFSNPAKVVDAYLNSIRHQPMVPSYKSKKLQPKSFLEGSLRSLLPRNAWEHLRGVDVDRPWIWE